MSALALTLAVSATLTAIAGLHLFWGLGGRWPGHDEASFVERTIGRTKDMKAPGLAVCALVALALMTAAGLVLWRGGVFELPEAVAGIAVVGFWTVAAVFALRGLAAYVPGVFAYARGTPFMALNTTLYAPLCLLLAAAIVAVGTDLLTIKL